MVNLDFLTTLKSVTINVGGYILVYAQILHENTAWGYSTPFGNTKQFPPHTSFFRATFPEVPPTPTFSFSSSKKTLKGESSLWKYSGGWYLPYSNPARPGTTDAAAGPFCKSADADTFAQLVAEGTGGELVVVQPADNLCGFPELSVDTGGPGVTYSPKQVGIEGVNPIRAWLIPLAKKDINKKIFTLLVKGSGTSPDASVLIGGAIKTVFFDIKHKPTSLLVPSGNGPIAGPTPNSFLGPYTSHSIGSAGTPVNGDSTWTFTPTSLSGGIFNQTA